MALNLKRLMSLVFIFLPVVVLSSLSYSTKTSSPASVWTGHEIRLRAPGQLSSYGKHWWGRVTMSPASLPLEHVHLPDSPLEEGKDVSPDMSDFFPEVRAIVSDAIESHDAGEELTGKFQLEIRYFNQSSMDIRGYAGVKSTEKSLEIPVTLIPGKPLIVPFHEVRLWLGGVFGWAVLGCWIFLIAYDRMTTGIMGHVFVAFTESTRGHLQMFSAPGKIVRIAGIVLQVVYAGKVGTVITGTTIGVVLWSALGLVHAIYWTKLILPPEWGRRAQPADE